MKTAKKIIFWCLASFAIIQLIPINKVNKPIDKKVNFIDVQKTPKKISELLKFACYDCHSNETVYPKYAYIAPLSWTINGHVSDAREHLNFSVWNTYNEDLKKSMLENTMEVITNKVMPKPSYIAYHPEANLTEAQRSLLKNYFGEILKSQK